MDFCCCCPLWLFGEKHPLQMWFFTNRPVPVVFSALWPQGAVMSSQRLGVSQLGEKDAALQTELAR